MTDGPHPTPDTGTRLVQARFAADAASVPGIRRFVRDAVGTRAQHSLADDAELCIGELAGNAALHSGSAFLEVAVRQDRGGVTLSVTDEGPVPPEAVVPRLVLHPDRDVVDPDTQSTTGRGLGIVAVLATEWGVDRTATGKCVWARITGDGADHPVRPPDSGPRPLDHPPAPTGETLPPGWGRVVLARCPVELSLRQDQHLDELIRELQLVATERDRRSTRVAEELRESLTEPAHARHMGRRTALEAAAAGLETTDIAMAMPLELAAGVLRLSELVREADRLCEEKRLLTLTSTPELRELRDWMTHEVWCQLGQQSEPVPWDEWLARRSDEA